MKAIGDRSKDKSFLIFLPATGAGSDGGSAATSGALSGAGTDSSTGAESNILNMGI